MWTTLAIIINIMRIAEIVNLRIDLIGDQVTWGNHKDQLREWAEKVTNTIRQIREKSIVGLLLRPSELCFPKVYDPQTKFLQKKRFFWYNTLFLARFGPFLTLFCPFNLT